VREPGVPHFKGRTTQKVHKPHDLRKTEERLTGPGEESLKMKGRSPRRADVLRVREMDLVPKKSRPYVFDKREWNSLLAGLVSGEGTSLYKHPQWDLLQQKIRLSHTLLFITGKRK